MAGNYRSGRRPKPTALKVFQGTRADRINADEPKPPTGDVVKPATMSAMAGVIWDRLAPIALEMRTLTSADLTAFTTLCELQATLELASAQKDPPVTGRRRILPFDVAIRLERQSAGALKPFLAMFGLEPSTRSRLKVPPATPSGLRAFLAKGHRGA